jgi:hypothetical protein
MNAPSASKLEIHAFLCEAQAFYEAAFSRLGIAREGACLLWAIAATVAARQQGHRAILQGGSANFLTVAHKRDDGVCNNGFGYTFIAAEAVQHVRAGNFPEMHVWAALPDVRPVPLLIDLTTGFQPVQLLRMRGVRWDEEVLPPPYLVAPVNDLPDELQYTADPVATAYAMRCAVELCGRDII